MLAYRIAADAVLMIHVMFVMFVVIGLVAIVIGKFRKWGWVYNIRFRVLHLTAISVVVIQSWFDWICPLTILEMWLRTQGGDATYPGSFVAHWLDALLYYRAPPWIFMVAYTCFGALVIFSWVWAKPYRKKSGASVP